MKINLITSLVSKFLFISVAGATGVSIASGQSDIVEAANVKSFGAVGDGINDDTASIQAALYSPYHRIYIPDGTYKLTNILRIPSNKQLTLSPTTTMLRKSNSSSMLLNNSDGTTGDYGSNANVIIEGGVWNGNAAEFPEACTIMGFGHMSDVIVRDCTIQNVPAWHAIELNAIRRGTIERVFFKTCTNEAVQLDTMNSANPGVFPWFGPYNDGICREIVIQDCTFVAVATAIGSHSAPPVEGLVIRRCVIDSSTDIAIKPVRYSNMSVVACEFNNCHTVFAGSAVGFLLRENRINNSRVADINLANCTNGVVEDNIITNSKSGIINASASVSIYGNRFDPVLNPIPPAIVSEKRFDYFIYDNSTKSGASASSPVRTGVLFTSVGKESATAALSNGDTATLAVTATGTLPLIYKWVKDGVTIASGTGPTLTITSVSPSAVGSYSVTISNSAGTVTTAPVQLTVSTTTTADSTSIALTNVSFRSFLASSDAVLTAGYSIKGTSEKRLLIRAIGPTLTRFGVSPALQDPRLEVLDSKGIRVSENNDWPEMLAPIFETAGAFPLPFGSANAAALVTVAAGFGTVEVRGTSPGIALLEFFDTSDTRMSRLVNLSARGRVGSGDSVLVAGFATSGVGTIRLLIRGIGQRLAEFGLSGTLADPRLELHNAEGDLVSTNDDWSPDLATTFTTAGAFTLVPGSKDAAMIVTVKGGARYSVLLRGNEGVTGEALLEIYELQ